ncbi:hypothetical protein HJC23_006119 [Cyclotella cryptica]|uniref:CCZ1/INTU/HSP4 first Longin domain-containing protein n=1 Tax=Cyclotella cryptica TaxID=29204 RepID=A0ABD3QKF0_9STRA|eukprot:CCRYP_004585-RA/>CCRYP_004585-RA protein AED:0.28 eAED:0.28 QI:0/-1/0/1/-1/1/1/0/959
MFARFNSHRHSSAPPRHSHSDFSPAGGASTQPPQVLIQRLIILHDGLLPFDCDGVEEEEEGGGDVAPVVIDDTSKGTKYPSNNNVVANVPKRKRRRNPQSFLSEDASLEEHGEFILYYYDHSLHSHRHGMKQSEVNPLKRGGSTGSHSTRSVADDGVDQVPNNHCTEEAVRFAGVCRALRSLPLALHSQQDCENDGGDSGRNEETDVVYLSDSTLVFIPLELDGDIFAVVQVPRASNSRQNVTQSKRQINAALSCNRRSRLGYGADPHAIRESIRHSYSLFSLLHGGGIHERLLRTNHLEKSVDWYIDEKGNSPGGNSIRQKRMSVSYSGTNVTFSNHEISKQTNMNYCYGGMKELFELRREDRKLNRSDDGVRGLGRSSWIRKSNTLEMFEDIADHMGRIACQDKIETLLQMLPITPLREDIKIYYDRWIAKMQGMCEVIEGGVGRSIVEMVPAPIRQDTARGQYPPISPSPFLCLAAAEFMRSLLADDICSKSNEFQLCGVSFLYQNRYVSSELLSPNNPKNQAEQESLLSEILMLSEYFCFQQNRESRAKQRERQKSTTLSTTHSGGKTPAFNPFDRWMSSISAGSIESEDARAKVSQSNCAMNGHATSHGSHESTGYISPPRLRVANFDKAVHSLYVHDLNCEVWLPRVHIPQLIARSKIDRNNDGTVETHVTLFGREEFNFLLFFTLHTTEDDEMSGFFVKTLKDQPRDVDGQASKHNEEHIGNMLPSDVLTLLANKMTRFCDEYSFRDHHSMSRIDAPINHVSSDTLFVGEPGMDIIFIDRENSTFFLLSQHDLSANDFQRRAKTTPPNDNNILTKGLFGIGLKIKETCDRENEVRSFSRSSSYIDMLDCRHKLAAYLPLDVMLAFDDMFNEIGGLRVRQNVQDTVQCRSREESNRGKMVELSTYLPQGWVYGRAHGGHELYILLDTGEFVTISDVTKAVTRIRERILNDTLF